MPEAKDCVYYPITGIPIRGTKEAQQGPNRKVPCRQNIDEWSSDPENAKQVKLFVMALDRFQKIDPTKRESYFQVAGELLTSTNMYKQLTSQASTANPMSPGMSL